MILKMPVTLAGVASEMMVNRDKITFVKPSHEGSKCEVFIDGMPTHILVNVRYTTMRDFLGLAFKETTMDASNAENAAVRRDKNFKDQLDALTGERK